MSSPPKKTRRSSADVRELLLEAARDLFRSEGYEAITTRQIAERAGVSEPLLFSNFGSKAGLFEAAVLSPIVDFVAGYAASWRDHDSDPPQERVDAFVRGLYAIAQRNRTMLLTAVMHRLANDRHAEPDVLDGLSQALQGVRGVSDLDRYDDVDAPAATAAVLGMVLGVALLDDLVFPSGSRRPSRDRLIAEMEKLTLHGITDRPQTNGRPHRTSRDRHV